MIKKLSATYNKILSSNVDAANGVIKNVVIVNEGLNKNGDNLDQTFLSSIASLGNLQSQGVKSRFGHPNMCDDALGTYIGRYKNFSLQQANEGGTTFYQVIADLHLDEVSNSSPKGKLKDYVLNMASANPDMFGNSIVYSADKPEVKELMEEGEPVSKSFERVKSFVASDVVDSPAATNNLFYSEDDFAARATEFLNDNPKLFAVLHKNPELLTQFLSKYENYKAMTEKKEPTLLETIQNGFKEMKEWLTKDKKLGVQIACDNGKMVTFDDPNNDGKADVGDNATIEDKPAEDGDYTATATGETYTVEDGVVTAVKPKEEDPKMPAAKGKTKPAPKEDEKMNAENEALKKANKELSDKVAEQETQFNDELKKLNDEFTAFKATVKSGFQPEGRENNFTGTGKIKEATSKEESRQEREDRKAQYKSNKKTTA